MIRCCVCEYLTDSSAIKIHLKSCHYYVNHIPTETTKWHEFDDYDSATAYAEEISQYYKKGWKRAECCMKGGANLIKNVKYSE